MASLLQQDFTTVVGLVAALCTTLSYIPQVRKCWRTGKAGDLSLRMLVILATGIGLWVLYGLLRGDAVIILANSVGFALLGIILVFKLREIAAGRAVARFGKATGAPID
ncbi:SemiSWEET family sugar transporter [Rhodoplanes sp. SY1]|uniref:SemiSWEET family sugar transporter n=1 Tax=Rhodoplanes sp. SY1 TaxID=3166646 RepID=UPI0038B54009